MFYIYLFVLEQPKCNHLNKKTRLDFVFNRFYCIVTFIHTLTYFILNCTLAYFVLNCTLAYFVLNCTLVYFVLNCTLAYFVLNCTLVYFVLNCTLTYFVLNCTLTYFVLNCTSAYFIFNSTSTCFILAVHCTQPLFWLAKIKYFPYKLPTLYWLYFVLKLYSDWLKVNIISYINRRMIKQFHYNRNNHTVNISKGKSYY